MVLTEYEKYIRTEELLSLQKDPSELTCHDEMQFQMVDQVAELWMKFEEARDELFSAWPQAMSAAGKDTSDHG